MDISADAQQQQQQQALAMKLNNRGALCMETGCYDKAISVLFKALKLSEHVMCEDSCTCKHCSLEYCISKSAKNNHYPIIPVVAQEEQHCCGPCNSSPGAKKAPCDAVMDFEGVLTNLASSQTGYFYQRPIRMSSHSMRQRHSPGVTLSLVIIFNLALSYHMSSLQISSKSGAVGSGAGVDLMSVQKALQLYELAYQLQLEQDNHCSSLRFTIIMANNLSQIHSAVGNTQKCTLCLEHLLSTMMYMVDNDLFGAEFDDWCGFFENASLLILRDQVAAAA
jgi:tetratricopeptide (TPR) repeat protein